MMPTKKERPTPEDFYASGQVPPEEDCILVTEAVRTYSREGYQLPYTKIQGWWNTGWIQHFNRGYRAVVSRRQIERMIRRDRTVVPSSSFTLDGQVGQEEQSEANK